MGVETSRDSERLPLKQHVVRGLAESEAGSGSTLWRFSTVPCTVLPMIDDDVVHPVTGLGGSDLKSIDVSFVLRESNLERERRIWKQWAKLPDWVWRIECAL